MIVMLLAVAVTAHAQEPAKQSNGFVTMSQLSVAAPINGHSEVSLLGLEENFGYAFNSRWTAYLPITYTLALFDMKEGLGRYEDTGSIGLGVGFHAIHNERERLEVIAKGGGGFFGGDDWQSTYCDLGVNYGTSASSGSMGAYVGAGVRYIGTTKGNMGNYFTLYVTIGFRFN